MANVKLVIAIIAIWVLAKKIVVFYKSTSVDKTKCPPELRDVGIHAAMVYKGQDNRKYWDYDAVNQVIVDCIDAR